MIYVLLIIEIILFIVAFKGCGSDLFSPSCFMIFMFTMSTACALLFKDAWQITFQLKTVLIISSGLLVATITDLSIQNIAKKQTDYIKNESTTIRIDIFLLIAIVVLGIISVVVFYNDVTNVVIGYGYNKTNLFETYRLIKNGRLESLTGNTPTTGFVANQLFRFLWAAAYVSAFCIANNLNTNKKTTQIGFHLTIIASASCLGIIEGARGGILQLGAAFVIDYFSCLRRCIGCNKRMTKFYIGLIACGIFIGIPTFYLSTKITGGASSKSMFEYIAFYVGGSIALLNMYIINPVPLNDMFWGEETFIGINNSLSQLGVNIQTKQVSLEFRQLQNDYNGNVYTFFRRPLHDFGVCGMLLCVAITIFFFSWIYHKKIQSSTKLNDYWILFYSLFFYWIVVSSIENYLFSISIGLVINIIVTMLIAIIVKNYSTAKLLNLLKQAHTRKGITKK